MCTDTMEPRAARAVDTGIGAINRERVAAAAEKAARVAPTTTTVLIALLRVVVPLVHTIPEIPGTATVILRVAVAATTAARAAAPRAARAAATAANPAKAAPTTTTTMTVPLRAVPLAPIPVDTTTAALVLVVRRPVPPPDLVRAPAVAKAVRAEEEHRRSVATCVLRRTRCKHPTNSLFNAHGSCDRILETRNRKRKKINVL